MSYPVRSENDLMSKLLSHLPWLVAGAALYHISRSILQQREERTHALLARQKAQREAQTRRLYLLTTACQRGTISLN